MFPRAHRPLNFRLIAPAIDRAETESACVPCSDRSASRHDVADYCRHVPTSNTRLAAAEEAIKGRADLPPSCADTRVTIRPRLVSLLPWSQAAELRPEGEHSRHQYSTTTPHRSTERAGPDDRVRRLKQGETRESATRRGDSDLSSESAGSTTAGSGLRTCTRATEHAHSYPQEQGADQSGEQRDVTLPSPTRPSTRQNTARPKSLNIARTRTPAAGLASPGVDSEMSTHVNASTARDYDLSADTVRMPVREGSITTTNPFLFYGCSWLLFLNKWCSR